MHNPVYRRVGQKYQFRLVAMRFNVFGDCHTFFAGCSCETQVEQLDIINADLKEIACCNIHPDTALPLWRGVLVYRFAVLQMLELSHSRLLNSPSE